MISAVNFDFPDYRNDMVQTHFAEISASLLQSLISLNQAMDDKLNAYQLSRLEGKPSPISTEEYITLLRLKEGLTFQTGSLAIAAGGRLEN